MYDVDHKWSGKMRAILQGEWFQLMTDWSVKDVGLLLTPLRPHRNSVCGILYVTVMFFQLTRVAVGVRFHFQLAEMFWCCCGRCCLLFLLITASSLESQMTITLKWLGPCDVTRICERHFYFYFCCKWKTKRKTKKLQLYSLSWATISNPSLQLGKKHSTSWFGQFAGGGYSAMDFHSFYPQVPSNWTTAISESWKFSKSDATRPYEAFSGYVQFWHQRLESFVAVIGGGGRKKWECCFGHKL